MKGKLLILSVLFFVPQLLLAADPLEVAPGRYSLLFENDQIRVMKVVFKPGEKIPEHSHPNHYVVVKAPGKLKISKADGSSSEVDLKSDQVIWIPAETHWAENVGDTQVELIVNEVKEKKIG